MASPIEKESDRGQDVAEIVLGIEIECVLSGDELVLLPLPGMTPSSLLPQVKMATLPLLRQLKQTRRLLHWCSSSAS